MVVGSAVKLAITGLDAVVAGAPPSVGLGGGGPGFTGFLQPEANTTSAIASSAALNFVAFDLVILELSSDVKNSMLLGCLAPNRFFVVSLICKLLLAGTVRQHSVDLCAAPAARRKRDMDAIGRPGGILITAGAVSQLNQVLRSGDIHHENIEISRLESTRPRKRDVLAIGTPGRVGAFAGAVGQSHHIRSINTHSIYLRRTGAARDKHEVGASLGIHLRFHVNGVRVGDAPQIAAVHIGHEDLR